MTVRTLGLACVLALVTLTACGDNRAAPADAGAPGDASGSAAAGPSVTITSPTAGATITGGRAITVIGTLAASSSSGAPITAVTASVGGVDAGLVTFDQTAFAITVTLGDNANAITVTATDQLAHTGHATADVAYPFVALTTFAPAQLVLGQPDMTSNDQGLAPDGISGPYGRPTWGGGVLWIGDYNNNRALGFRGFPARDGTPAELVIGEPDLYSRAGQASANRTRGIETLQIVDGHLYADDYDSGRITVYDTLPTMSSPTADFAIGQPDLVTDAGTCDRAHVTDSEDFIIAGGKLIMSDSDNNRVLIWNTVPTAAGALPDVVLGQGDFTHCNADDDAQAGADTEVPTARTLAYPAGVWSDGTRLIVADQSNARVLIWNAIPTASFTRADVVLGQPDFTSSDTDTTRAALNEPYYIDSNGNQLAVADQANARVLIWNTMPTTPGALPDVVLGQSDFVHGTDNDDNQDGVEDPAPTARTLGGVTGVRFVRDTLIVTDNGNNRYLIYGDLPCATGDDETPADSGTCVADPCVGACGGGYCDSSSGAAVCAPTVTLTSPIDGGVITGARTATVTGTLDGGGGAITAVTATVNGTPVATVTFDQTSFSFPATLLDQANALTVNATGAYGERTTVTAAFTYPFVTLSSFATAELVLGQADAVSVQSGPTPALFRNVLGRPWWTAGTLWLADSGDLRVVGYQGFPSRTGEPADVVIGAPDLSTRAGGTSATLLQTPSTIQGADGHLFVTDRANGRILVYTTPPTATQAAAAYAIGELDLNTAGTACAGATLDTAADVQIVDDKVLVVDPLNSRVLIWNTLPAASGVAPDVVLGQGDFAHCEPNDDNQDGVTDAATARTLNLPAAVWSDGTRVVISDEANQRVLVWSTFPTASFTPADAVLGQASSTAVAPLAASATTFFQPTSIDSNGQQLAIVDHGNDRVLIWNAFPATSATPADLVLGQADFTHVASNDDDQDGVTDATPSGRTLSAPSGVRFVRGTLIVADGGNQRYLVFGALPCPAGDYETPPDSGTCVVDPCVGACAGQLCDNSTGAAVCF